MAKVNHKADNIIEAFGFSIKFYKILRGVVLNTLIMMKNENSASNSEIYEAIFKELEKEKRFKR